MWVKSAGKIFNNPRIARRYLQATMNPTTDVVASGLVEIERPIDISRSGQKFAEVSVNHEYLVRN